MKDHNGNQVVVEGRATSIDIGAYTISANNNDIFVDYVEIEGKQMIFDGYVLVALKKTNWLAPLARLLGRASVRAEY